MPSRFTKNIRSGRRFESEERAGWAHVPREHVRHEAATKWQSKKGRIDIKIDEGSGVVTLVEIKASNWDALKPERIRATALRHARQVWRYINDFSDNQGKDVFAGIVYENEPANPEIRRVVEQILNDRFIQVAWRKEKSGKKM
jgi:hypothetical protein